MLLFGKNITSQGDQLLKISVFELYEKISRPSPELESLINTLRTVLSIDEQKYRKLKTQLPYFCTSAFNPPFRKADNFASAEQFILDFDHIAEAEINIDELKNRLSNDLRVNLLFTSPGNNGLKIMFQLSEKCYDKGKYSIFYKLFAKKFAEQYNLLQVIDTKTSDVARACFLSADKNAFYNAVPLEINISDYINFESLEELKFAENIISEMETVEKTKLKEQKEDVMPDDILMQIKLKLNPNIRIKKEKQIYVPEKLEEVITQIEIRSAEIGLKMAEVTNINYGKKIRFEAGQYFAEINVFFGQKGFTIVKTTKKGSSTELADSANMLLCDILYPENKK
jgi:hypothetical protein